MEPKRKKSGGRSALLFAFALAAALSASPYRVHAAPSGYAHIVVPGETPNSLSADYGISERSIRLANGLSQDAPLTPGTLITIPKREIDQLATSAADATRAGTQDAQARPTAEANTAPRPSSAPREVKRLPKTRPASAETGEAEVAALGSQGNSALPSGPPALSSKERIETIGFRWPAKGRIIRAFGADPSGLFNEGINIALPEGTVVRAAEDGKVIYAGNGYPNLGNIVIIDHSDAWVSVYAHTKTIGVRPDDTVKRGQAIATAGLSGEVDHPQLHFQIRKDKKPYNPQGLLASP